MSNGDLISREALKEDFKERNIWNPEIISAIDNAPSVDLKDIYQEGHYDGHIEGYTKAINEERPQGKWIPMNPDCRGYSDYFKCSICGAYIYPRNAEKELDYNGCPYCFADMRGKEE